VKIGKLFHLTMLVDDLGATEQFFNGVFAPLCIMRSYSAHWHRHAAMYVIGETCIEPMHVLPPEPGGTGTSWYRFMAQHGPRIHNLAFHCDDLAALDKRLGAAGIRTTDGGTGGGTLFAHPKDTPGMVEFYTPAEPGFLTMDPRLRPHWEGFSRDYWPNQHPLRLLRLSHITILVNDVDKACDFYGTVLDGTVLPPQRSRLEGVESRHVLVGEDTVVELAHPIDTGSALGRELATVGEGAIGATFLVRDLDRALAYLQGHPDSGGGQPILETGAHDIVLDRTKTWGVEFRFTDEGLVGDPATRSSRWSPVGPRARC